jgi:hypothetical protein
VSLIDEIEIPEYASSPDAQCERCGRDFRITLDEHPSLVGLCNGCADHAVLCGCNDEFCGEA